MNRSRVVTFAPTGSRPILVPIEDGTDRKEVSRVSCEVGAVQDLHIIGA